MEGPIPTNTEFESFDPEAKRLSGLLADTMVEMSKIDDRNDLEYIRLEAKYKELNDRLSKCFEGLEEAA